MMFDFGITPDQAAARRALIVAGDGRLSDSDSASFTPKAGLKETRGTVQLSYVLRGQWRAVGLMSLGGLAREVSDSPLSRKDRAMIAAAGIAYGW
jgi:outer membrane scaffolding protein for murein synthesis (MipA/OmpV family)